MLLSDDITEQVIGAAVEVHRELGPGLLESVYEEALCHEPSLREVAFARQVPVPISYKGVNLGSDCRIDILAEDTVIVELKAVAEVLPVHKAQLLSYMRLSGKQVGLLLNFNVAVLKDGIVRRVL